MSEMKIGWLGTENDRLYARIDRLYARIAALEAAGKRLAEAAIRLDADDITSALAAWRAAEKGEG